MNIEERRKYLIEKLLEETKSDTSIPESEEEQRKLLRGLLNVRKPGAIDSEFLIVQDAYLQEVLSQKGITFIDELTPINGKMYLWQGDITTLQVDAIVNAANSALTGCFIPNHKCIDNTIHTYAGIQLRNECADIVAKQGHEEVVGNAKITSGYNLPAKHIIHTVGPMCHGSVKESDREQLRSCYRSCLELAAANNLESIAFCCISTGEFHFPNDEAAKIAVETVKEFLKNDTSIQKVVFNVFKDSDKQIYRKLLSRACW